jgi:DNA-binding response OmpR family regulator
MPANNVILLAEDDNDDAFFLRKALQRAQIVCSLVHVRNGEEAINYLLGVDKFSDRSAHPEPGLIITDLKMHKVSGFDLLSWLKEKHSALPVIVLSGSSQEADRKRALELGAHAYWVKPPDPDNWVAMVQQLKQIEPFRSLA